MREHRTTLLVEGQHTLDGRLIRPKAIAWRLEPLPIIALVDEHVGGELETVAVNVGELRYIERMGHELCATVYLEREFTPADHFLAVDIQTMRSEHRHGEPLWPLRIIAGDLVGAHVWRRSPATQPAHPRWGMLRPDLRRAMWRRQATMVAA